MDKFDIGVIICISCILFLFQLLERFFKPNDNLRQVGAKPILPILPPGIPPDYIDDKCSFIVRRGVDRTANPDSGMTQPMLRPCGLNHIFIQNCKGEMLNGKGPEQLLVWEKEADIHQSGKQDGCFLIVAPINGEFRNRPGHYYVSIKSMRWNGYYMRMRNGKAILGTPSPQTCQDSCEPPAYRDFVFEIERGYAKFNRAFSILTWNHDYLQVEGKHLVLKLDDPDSEEEKINSTLYFGPNNNLLNAELI